MENKKAGDFNFSKSDRSSSSNRTRLLICPTTGGSFEVNLPAHETVNGLKNAISRKLKIPQAKINLLFKERLLKFGTLHDNNITDSSQVTLLPSLESGFSYPREDSSVVQALESLSESQVNDFLSGRAPLVLAMRVGDHMMFIQLQLSTSPCTGRRPRPSPVVVPSPGQISVQDHQEIPSPTASRDNHTMSRNISNFSDFPASTPKQHTRKGVSEVLSSRSNSLGQHQFFSSPQPQASPLTPSPTSGAVIDSMHHLGGGVYSGKFSGTLDPALQDQGGRPRRDISTIIHILNDLLGATPQYRHGMALHQSRTTSSKRPQPCKVNQRADVHEPEDSKLREKVQELKKMMEERKFRRKERRDVRAPYHWNNRSYHYGQGHVCIPECAMKGQGHSGQEPMEDGVPVSAGYQGNSGNIEQDTLAV